MAEQPQQLPDNSQTLLGPDSAKKPTLRDITNTAREHVDEAQQMLATARAIAEKLSALNVPETRALILRLATELPAPQVAQLATELNRARESSTGSRTHDTTSLKEHGRVASGEVAQRSLGAAIESDYHSLLFAIEHLDTEMNPDAAADIVRDIKALVRAIRDNTERLARTLEHEKSQQRESEQQERERVMALARELSLDEARNGLANAMRGFAASAGESRAQT